jgi:hypothetical protein
MAQIMDSSQIKTPVPTAIPYTKKRVGHARTGQWANNLEQTLPQIDARAASASKVQTPCAPEKRNSASI